MAQEVINGKIVRRWFTRGKARIPIFEDGSIGIDRYVTQGVVDREKLKGETREQRQKWNSAFHYGHNKEYYENIMKKWEKDANEAENTTDKKFAQGQYDAWKKNYDDTVEQENEFNKLYYGQSEVPDASYMIDYNAKTREGRYANYGTVDVTKQDKAIESDIKSLFTYQNEKNMGSLRDEPLKQYYDKYGKENVDRAWKRLDDKYAVIQGTNMDYEGLRYSELVEKDKYSPEAIDYYRKQVEKAWEENGWDTKRFNEATRKAKEEFEKFDNKRSSWDEENFYEKALNDDKIRISDEYQSPNGVPLRVLAKDVSDRYIINEAGNEYRVKEDELKSILSDGQYEKVGYSGRRKEVTDYQKSKEDTTEKWSDKDKYEYDLYKRAKENPDSIDPMTENSTDWDALDKKWSNRYDYDKEQEEFGTEAQVERFKERKGKVSKKDMSYGDFLEKKFGNRIDRNDLTEDDDDRYYKEYLRYINK